VVELEGIKDSSKLYIGGHIEMLNMNAMRREDFSGAIGCVSGKNNLQSKAPLGHSPHGFVECFLFLTDR